MKMKTGDEARLIQPVIQGSIVETEYDKDKEQLKHLLEYKDVDDEVKQRWFAEDELEQVVEAKGVK